MLLITDEFQKIIFDSETLPSAATPFSFQVCKKFQDNTRHSTGIFAKNNCQKNNDINYQSSRTSHENCSVNSRGKLRNRAHPVKEGTKDANAGSILASNRLHPEGIAWMYAFLLPSRV